MKKSIIALNAPNNARFYIKRPFWYKYWREGKWRKRIGYHLTSQKNIAHKFIKRKNIRLIMNDAALRYKMNPTLIQCQ